MAVEQPSPGQKIKELLSARRLGHDANQLLVDIMERWGGTKSFADALVVEFQAAKPGSLIRANLLEMIQKLVVNNTNHNITRIVDPADLEDDEIESEMGAVLKRALDFYHESGSAPHAAAHAPPWQAEDAPPGGDRWDWDDARGAGGDPPRPGGQGPPPAPG
jgi:hypothetical protein